MSQRGLGDTVAEVAKALRLDWAAARTAKSLGKKDCGCKGRQATLNRLVPYRRVEPSAATAGPRPKAVLQGLLANPLLRERMWEQAAAITAGFPVDGAVVLPWVCLQNAGVATYYHPEVSGWVKRLVHQGMRMYPVSMVSAEPGDLWVQVNADKVPSACGLVAEVGDEGPRSFDGRHQAVRPLPAAEIDYILRLP